MAMKIVRILLVLALAFALPLRGYAAAGYMACSHSHGADAVTAAHGHAGHDHGGHGHADHGHADHGHAVADGAGAANDATAGDPAASTCSVCCAGCAFALFDARPHGPVLDDPIASLLPVDVTRYASVVGDNPQRPPAIA